MALPPPPPTEERRVRREVLTVATESRVREGIMDLDMAVLPRGITAGATEVILTRDMPDTTAMQVALLMA